MNPYSTVSLPPQYNDESYFNYALLSHVKFAIAVVVILLLVLILLWNSQPWFEIRIERANQSLSETTQNTDGGNLKLSLQNNVAWADYRVRSGETLSEIAERHGIGLSTLLKYNGIGNPNLVYVGQRLKIPRHQ